ncbi:MAG: N-acetyltransferase [Alphaproteobacteria bacterium HGW-Alphaproteobacteria-16]|nr:MAG: N-acetyltransferase [Alphaproteobacteria bacterium HGW-Alphaproteobacteria-16]
MDSDIRDNVDRHRYETTVDGKVAYAEYRVDGDVVTFTHTVVPPALEGRGIASRLIAHALADVRGAGMKLVPQCPFVAAYIDKHPEWADLLA